MSNFGVQKNSMSGNLAHSWAVDTVDGLLDELDNPRAICRHCRFWDDPLPIEGGCPNIGEPFSDSSCVYYSDRESFISLFETAFRIVFQNLAEISS